MSDENLDHGPVVDTRDRDETRRLLYGALAAGRTKRWELVGTLVNALVHHSGLVEDPYALLDSLINVVEADPGDATPDHGGFAEVRALIAQLDTTNS